MVDAAAVRFQRAAALGGRGRVVASPRWRWLIAAVVSIRSRRWHLVRRRARPTIVAVLARVAAVAATGVARVAAAAIARRFAALLHFATAAAAPVTAMFAMMPAAAATVAAAVATRVATASMTTMPGQRRLFAADERDAHRREEYAHTESECSIHNHASR